MSLRDDKNAFRSDHLIQHVLVVFVLNYLLMFHFGGNFVTDLAQFLLRGIIPEYINAEYFYDPKINRASPIDLRELGFAVRASIIALPIQLFFFVFAWFAICISNRQFVSFLLGRHLWVALGSQWLLPMLLISNSIYALISSAKPGEKFLDYHQSTLVDNTTLIFVSLIIWKLVRKVSYEKG
ncbi:hypothetical protein [Maritalea sp.]|uniref:hypothetical protein n=1 Tax=Maritalea sp. TaxID=2003361 RepID=UPI003EF09DB6